MNATTIVQTDWNAILAAITGTGGPWDGAIMKLFQNNFNPTSRSVLGDFTIADFTGYADSTAIVWGTPGYLPDGTAVVLGDSKTFTVGASPTVLNTIYGWYLTDGGGTELIMARKFDSPIVLSGAGQLLSVLPAYVTYTGS